MRKIVIKFNRCINGLDNIRKIRYNIHINKSKTEVIKNEDKRDTVSSNKASI